MNKDTMNKLVYGFALEGARSIKKSGDDVQSIAFLFTDIDKDALAFPLLGDKMEASSELAEIVETKNINTVIIVTEGWLVKTSVPDIEVPPSKHPDRVEAIIVELVDRGGDSLIVFQEFYKEGDTIVFKPPVSTEGTHSSIFTSSLFLEINSLHGNC